MQEFKMSLMKITAHMALVSTEQEEVPGYLYT
jgi:hypothetical protein